MRRLPTEASFLKDVAEHAMTVKFDDGLYRHLRFSRANSWNMGFDLTTWPGFLAFSGDMGCYVFSRLPDMFQFFRKEGGHGPALYINPGYWGEKIRAVDRNGPLEEYDPERFKDAVGRWMDEGEWPHAVREAVAEEVLSMADEGEHEAMRAALDFDRDNYTFSDFHEVSVREIGHRFVWCCYAIAWGVGKYDESKKCGLVESGGKQ